MTRQENGASLSGRLRRRLRLTVALAAIVGASALSSTTATSDEVAYDDFETLGPLMLPFDLNDQYFKPGGIPPWADGTDWSKDFPAGWTLDNSGNLYDNTDMPGEFDGWSLMDVTSWIAHAGVQAGRDRCYFGEPIIDGVQYRNTVLVADPDEADDNTQIDPNLYNSYVTRAYDVSTADLNSLVLSFDFDFITDGNQSGVVDVTFDGGVTWQNLLTMTVTDPGSNVPFGTFADPAESGEFSAANGDFTPAAGATEMQVRFGCINSGNNWWFAVDNVGLTDLNGVIAFEDFEDLADSLVAFNYDVNGAPTSPDPLPPFDPSDGTDWIGDLSSVGWEIINDGPADSPEKRMYFESLEGAYNGGAVLDAFSWSYQTDGSNPTAADEIDVNSGWGQRRTMFRDSFFGMRNSVLVFDPDQAFDNRVPGSDENAPGLDEPRFNSFAQKLYDMKAFDNDSVSVELEWEIRVEEPQVNVIEISFDGGDSWTRIFELDASNLADPALQAEFLPYLDFQNSGGDPLVIESGEVVRTFSTGPQTIVVNDFFADGNVPDSNTMLLRIGCLDADNDWWFAVDNIRIDATAQGFVIGDANGDGDANFADVNAGVSAILTGTYSLEMDVNEDGLVNFGDLNGFVNAILGN